jgi:hypothetical protein
MTAADRWAQTLPMPPPGQVTVICARCGARYLPSDPGRQAHAVVFGHIPAAKEQQS